MAIRNGIKAPGQLTAAANAAGRLEIVHADPQVWLSGELIVELIEGPRHPDVQFDAPLDWANGRGLAGSVLTIDALDRRVVYVVRAYLPGPGCWLAEWPDW
mgnify:FL=1